MLRTWHILAFLWPSIACAELVINEIDVDQVGADCAEFIEIYNSGPGDVDFAVEPYVIVLFNGGDASPPVIDGSYRAIDLSGVLEVGAFLVVGSEEIPTVSIPFAGSVNQIQNGTDAVALYRGSTLDWSVQRAPTADQLVDAIVYDTDDVDDPALQQALGLIEQFDEWNGQGGVGVVFSIARHPDGGPFHTGATPTPGESNDAAPPLFALADTTLLHRDAPAPVLVKLRGAGGVGALRFRVRTLPAVGWLYDGGTILTGAGATSLPHLLVDALTYLPAPTWQGVATFEFDAVDMLDRVSAPAYQELAVQVGGVVITEIMHSPGTFTSPQDQRIYEYVEVFNYSDTDVPLTRLDGSIHTDVDTTDNLCTDGAPSVIEAWTMRILAPGGLASTSDETFRCEWGLSEGDILRVPYERYENMYTGSRLLLFGSGDVLLDAVNLGPEDFWPAIAGASQSVKEAYLELFEVGLDSVGNDILAVWPYAGIENAQGLRTSYSGVGRGSPGFVPADYNEDFVPLPECVPPPIGACCLPNGQCAAMSEANCDGNAGEYSGDNVTCAAAGPCAQEAEGSCCLPSGDCWQTGAHDCTLWGGTYGGDETDCAVIQCASDLQVVINELDYSQAGIDIAEYVELYGSAGLPLTGYVLVLYNGAPDHLAPYHTIPLAGSIPDDGFYVIGSTDVQNVDLAAFTVDGLQDGDPDGVALIGSSGEVVEAIAYGGAFVAAEGPAAGATFADIGVVDVPPPNNDPAQEATLQRVPNGVGPWVVTTDGGLGADGTPGAVNGIPFPAAYGRCCLPSGLCLEGLEPPQCAEAGGVYGGDASVCEGDCPVLTGACCLPNGECVIVTEPVCQSETGGFAGAGVECSAGPPCTSPPAGACCLVGGNCVSEDAYDCAALSGDFRGDGTSCAGQDCGAPTELTINEVYRNDASIDDAEFIELYGPGGMDLAGLSIVVIEGDHTPGGQEGKVDKVWLLDAFTMPGDGMFVLGDAAVPEADFVIGEVNELENGTATIVLVEGFDAFAFPVGFDLDSDDDGVLDAGLNVGVVVDGVAFADDGVDEDPPAVDRTYLGVVVVGPDGSDAPAGVARRVDGLTTGSAADFCYLSEAGNGSDGDAIPTPGAANTCSSCAVGGDANGDTAVDLLDFGILQACFSGPVGPASPPVYGAGCVCVDFDVDGDVDLADYAVFGAMAGGG